MSRGFIPFAVPMTDESEVTEVLQVLESGWLSTGPRTKRFEEDVASYLGAGNTVAVSSCTAGLHLSLVALDIGPGDEVILPTTTFCATANVVEHVGAKPVLVDIDDVQNICIESVRAAITERTKAIMPVHFAGQPCDLDEIYELATDRGLAVVEDAAHAIGSSYRGNLIGADSAPSVPELRRTVVFSFYATKNMTTGEGGMVATSNEQLADRIRLLSLHGMNRDAWKRYTSAGSWFYEVTEPGFKANMTDIQAALGLHQLAKLDTFNAARKAQADWYDDVLSQIPAAIPPIRRSDRDHIFHLYVLQLDPAISPVDRDGLIGRLREREIGTSVHFIPIHLHPYYAKTYGYNELDFPVATGTYCRSLSLPIYPKLQPEELEYITQSLIEILGDAS